MPSLWQGKHLTMDEIIPVIEEKQSTIKNISWCFLIREKNACFTALDQHWLYVFCFFPLSNWDTEVICFYLLLSFWGWEKNRGQIALLLSLQITQPKRTTCVPAGDAWTSPKAFTGFSDFGQHSWGRVGRKLFCIWEESAKEVYWPEDRLWHTDNVFSKLISFSS